jgi:hypothetical protein
VNRDTLSALLLHLRLPSLLLLRKPLASSR